MKRLLRSCCLPFVFVLVLVPKVWSQAIHTLSFKEDLTVSCGFGCYTGHQGNDYPTDEGTGVLASADGVVETASDTDAPNDPNLDPPNSPGNYIVIDHGVHNGVRVRTYYYHLLTGSFVVQEGEQVSRGQLIAGSGNSGTSTTPHIHFEVRHGDGEQQIAVDPYDSNNYLWTTNPPSHVIYLALTYAEFNNNSTNGWVAQNGITSQSFSEEGGVKYWRFIAHEDPYIISSEFSTGMNTDQFEKIVVRMAVEQFIASHEEPIHAYVDIGEGFNESTKIPQNNPDIVQTDNQFHEYEIFFNQTYSSDIKRIRIDPEYNENLGFYPEDVVRIDYIRMLSIFTEWEFQNSAYSWTLNNAASESNYNNTWQINPYGSDPQIISPYLDAVDLTVYDSVLVRFSVHGNSQQVTGYIFFDYGEGNFVQSGDRYATIQVTRDNAEYDYKIDIPRNTGFLRRIRINPFENQEGDNDKIYLRRIQFFDDGFSGTLVNGSSLLSSLTLLEPKFILTATPGLLMES